MATPQRRLHRVTIRNHLRGLVARGGPDRRYKSISFPATFKHALVTPLLKGHALDKSVPSNYRPISNLNFISKVLERLFLSRFQAYILASPNFNQYQSAYCPGCSTETALQLLLDLLELDVLSVGTVARYM